MSDVAYHPYIPVKNVKKLPNMASGSTRLARQTRRVGRATPHINSSLTHSSGPVVGINYTLYYCWNSALTTLRV